jgi:putative CocE/NonD family hydrolase
MVTMRDGVALRTDLYLPDAAGPHPTLVSRSPYNPHDGSSAMFARMIAAQGYAVVVQSTRGRFGSEGVFEPLQSDVEDGVDCIEWAAAQEWSTGRVGMFGSSYAGMTQWLAAIGTPPHLACIAPTVAPWDVAHGGFYHSPGVMTMGLAVLWSAQMTVFEAQSRDAVPPLPVFAEAARMMEAGGLGSIEGMRELFGMQPRAAKELYEHRPLRDVPGFEEYASWFREWADSGDPDAPYWKRISAAAHADDIALPVLHIAGWNDYFVKGGLDAFRTLSHRADAAERGEQRLVVGPWNHNTMQLRPDAAADAGIFYDFSPEGPTMRFFAHHLQGAEDGYRGEAPVRLYVMGENVWRDEGEWPLARTEWTPFHLRENGVLSLECPEDETPDKFRFDPAHPAPGPIAQGATYDDAVDLAQVAERDDVLVYVAAPFDGPVEITGPVRLELWAATSAPSTDFTAALSEVFPDGTTVPLCEGIVRVGADGEHLEPDRVARHEIDLVATSVLIAPGHRLRLDVSSSIYPTFELNPNTGARIMDSTEVAVADQTIRHDAAHPSRLILPIIPR